MHCIELLFIELDALIGLVSLQHIIYLHGGHQRCARGNQPVRHRLGNLLLHDQSTQRLNTIVANNETAIG